LQIVVTATIAAPHLELAPLRVSIPVGARTLTASSTAPVVFRNPQAYAVPFRCILDTGNSAEFTVEPSAGVVPPNASLTVLARWREPITALTTSNARVALSKSGKTLAENMALFRVHVPGGDDDVPLHLVADFAGSRLVPDRRRIVWGVLPVHCPDSRTVVLQNSGDTDALVAWV
jgi:hypothetical protein